ncbi:hypothetical protein D3C71_1648690 [compost metagenome]
MEIGDKLNLRCPKCKGSTMRLHEEFSAFDTYEIEQGVYTIRYMDCLPSTTGATYGECLNKGCLHKWKFRKNPIT